MIVTVTMIEKDERTEVSAVHFSHPTLDVPAGAPLDSAEAQELAPVLFLAPAGLPDADEQDEPADRHPSDRYPSRRPPIGESRHPRRSPRTTN